MDVGAVGEMVVRRKLHGIVRCWLELDWRWQQRKGRSSGNGDSLHSMAFFFEKYLIYRCGVFACFIV